MPSSIILPQCLLSNLEQKLDLTLRTSMQIQFASSFAVPSTFGELSDLVTDRHLWIARTGACYLKLSISIQGDLVSDESRIAKLAEWVQGCQFWDRLGLRLQYHGTGVAWPPGEMAFSIQHPDLSSALIPPDDALTAVFSSVTCSIDFSTREDASISGKRRTCWKYSSSRSKRGKPTGIVVDELYHNLESTDQQAIDEFMNSLDSSSEGRQGQLGNSDEPAQHLAEDQDVCIFERHRIMIEAALKTLILGKGKLPKDVIFLEKCPPLALMTLIPGVFNIPYVQALSERESLFPIISQSLARMRNAESPGLRQKVASFEAMASTDDRDAANVDKLVRGVERATWNMLLATIKTSRRRPKSGVQESLPNSLQQHFDPHAETLELGVHGSNPIMHTHTEFENPMQILTEEPHNSQAPYTTVPAFVSSQESTCSSNSLLPMQLYELPATPQIASAHGHTEFQKSDSAARDVQSLRFTGGLYETWALNCISPLTPEGPHYYYPIHDSAALITDDLTAQTYLLPNRHFPNIS